MSASQETLQAAETLDMLALLQIYVAHTPLLRESQKVWFQARVLHHFPHNTRRHLGHPSHIAEHGSRPSGPLRQAPLVLPSLA